MIRFSPYDSLHAHAVEQPGTLVPQTLSPLETVHAHAANDPTRAYPTVDLWAQKDIALRARWIIPLERSRQRIFIVLLKKEGLDDFELPVHTITMRMRDVKGSYVSCNIPNPMAYTEDILDRTDGRMHIYAGELTADGERHLEELIYANIDEIYFNQGSTNDLTLTGLRYITHENPIESELEGISRMVLDERGRYRVRCGVDWFVKPTDLVTALDQSFMVDFINYVITPNDAYMDVEGI